MTYGYNANAILGSEGTIRTHASLFLETITIERDNGDVSILSHAIGGGGGS